MVFLLSPDINSNMFSQPSEAWKTGQERSPWQAGSRALVVLAYYLIELCKARGLKFCHLPWKFGGVSPFVGLRFALFFGALKFWKQESMSTGSLVHHIGNHRLSHICAAGQRSLRCNCLWRRGFLLGPCSVSPWLPRIPLNGGLS